MGTGSSMIQAFCTVTLSDSTNVLTDSEYSGDIDRLKGHQKGIARVKLENKVLRQSSIMAAGVAEFIVKYCSTAQNYSIADASPETPTTIADKLKATVQNQTFPAGTRLAFSQSTAPLGWVQVNDNATSGHMLRIINNTTVTNQGTGIISTGGVHSPILMNVVPKHTHGGTTTSVDINHTHDFSVNTGMENQFHTHSFNANTGTESQPHTHEYFRPLHAADTDRGGSGSFWSIDQGETVQTGGQSQTHTHNVSGTTANQVQGHIHNVTGTTAGIKNTVNQTHAHTYTTDTGSSGTDWQPKYLDAILCSKS